MEPVKFGANRIVSSSIHAPPSGLGAFASDRSNPLSRSIRLSRPLPKNPSDWLSGDQNGKNPSSVPASGFDDTESNGRTHKRGRPSTVATKTIFEPSGETASEIGSVVVGVATSKRTSRADSAGSRRDHTASTRASSARRAAIIHGSRAREVDRVIAAGAGGGSRCASSI